MPVNNPDRAFFWDATNKSWRAAQVGDPGEYVWNDTTKSWEFGDIGAEYKWNRTTRAWEPGPGGQYVYNRSTKSWDKVTSPGYGGPFYWDTSTNSWAKNTDAAQVSDAFARWDFINNQAWWNGAYVGGLSSTPNWTASPATHSGGLNTYARKADGSLQAFASGTLRRTDRGALIEGAGTNLCLQSQTFDNATWVKTEATISADAVAAPDGTTTADKLVESSNTAAHNVRQSIAVTSGTTYTFSVYAKAAERTKLSVYGSGGMAHSARIDLSTGTVESGSATVTTLANGWYRIALTATASATGGAFFWMELYNGAGSYAGNGTSGLYLWGAQLEATAYASSYIPTTTASATRAADSLTVTGVSGLDYPLTLYAEIERASDAGTTETVFSVDDGSTNNRAPLSISSADLVTQVVTAGGAAQAAANVSGALAVGTTYKLAARIDTNDVIAAKAGSLGTQDASVTLPSTPTTIRFGAGVSGASPGYLYLRRLALFSRALSDAELQALTT